MGIFGKIFITIIIIVAIVGGYVFLTSDNDFSMRFLSEDKSEGIKNFFNKSTDKVEENITPIVDNASDKAEPILSAAIGYVTSGLSDVANTVTDKAQELGRDILNKSEQAIEKKIGIESKADQISEGKIYVGASPIIYSHYSYLIKVNEIMTFTIKPAMFEDFPNNFDCNVDWGDAKTESRKNIVNGSSIEFGHIWQKSGDYLISFKCASDGKKREYVERISVLE